MHHDYLLENLACLKKSDGSRQLRLAYRNNLRISLILDEQIPLNNLKRLAEELNKLKADFLEDLRRGNRKYLCFQQTTDLSDVISSFCDERDTVVQKYFSKQH